MDRNKAKDIAAAVDTALRGVATSFDLDVEFKGGSFDGRTYRPKVEFKERDSDEKRFRTFAASYGLAPGDFGRAFTRTGRRYTIVALALSRTARPVVTTRDDGKRFLWPADAVTAYLAASTR